MKTNPKAIVLILNTSADNCIPDVFLLRWRVKARVDRTVLSC